MPTVKELAPLPLKEPIRVDYTVTRTSNGGLRFEIETNLPVETNTSLTLKCDSSNYYRRSDDIISTPTYTVVYKVVPDGEYRVEFLVPIPFGQPKRVQAAMGKEGEHLSGQLLKEGPFEQPVVRRDATVIVSKAEVQRLYDPLPTVGYRREERSFTNAEWEDWMSDNNLLEKKTHYYEIKKAFDRSLTEDNTATTGMSLVDRETALDSSDKKHLEMLAKQLQLRFDYLRAINAKGQLLGW
jgi:hypothetical protein